MPLYMCRKCGSVDNTATGGYWAQQMNAHDAQRQHEPLCSACDPAVGSWHNLFPRRRAEGYVQDKNGYLYLPEEADGYFKHMGPFKPVPLPETGSTVRG